MNVFIRFFCVSQKLKRMQITCYIIPLFHALKGYSKRVYLLLKIMRTYIKKSNMWAGENISSILINMYVKACNRDWDFVYDTVCRNGMDEWVGGLKGTTLPYGLEPSPTRCGWTMPKARHSETWSFLRGHALKHQGHSILQNIKSTERLVNCVSNNLTQPVNKFFKDFYFQYLLENALIWFFIIQSQMFALRN